MELRQEDEYVPPVDKSQLISTLFKVKGLVKQHIDTYNYFINHGIKKILQANNFIACSHNPNIYLRYTNIRVGKPIVKLDHSKFWLTPQMCRLSDQTYAAPIMVDVEYTIANRATKNLEVKRQAGLPIGMMPIMLRSSHCLLSGKEDAQLSKLGECPLDPGGYFIVKGTEKVILMQEQLSKNRIIIDTDSKGREHFLSTFTIIITTLIRVTASVTSSTHETKSKTVFFMDEEEIYLHLNQFNEPIPIVVILMAMGMENVLDIVQMVGSVHEDLLAASILDCMNKNIYTQQQALNFLDGKIGITNPTNHGNKKTGLAKAILRNVFLAHVPLNEDNFHPRRIYTAVMIRRMLDAFSTHTFDDKDYLGNKQLLLSGQLISMLFENLFKSMNTHILELANKEYKEHYRSSDVNFDRYLRLNKVITLGLERSISTGNWDLKQFKMHLKGVSQVVSRLSYIAMLSHMTRISSQLEKTGKVIGPRELHTSQWGMLCPCDTPVGEGCGLTKNLALLTHVTTDEEDGPLISLCYTLGVEALSLLADEDLHSPQSYLVMLNGLILGKHKQPKLFAGNMRESRRCGEIGGFVSIFVNEEQRCVYIASDCGRVCRPLVIADGGISRIKDYHMKQLQHGIRTFDDFLRDGLIEYLDVNEENNALIALHECENGTDDPEKKKGDITHIEIDPLTILDADNERVLLLGEVGYDKLGLGAGQNAIVAVMSYSGYDTGGAIVMNKSSLDRGFGRCIILDDDGIAAPGEIIRNNDIYVNKKTPINTRERIGGYRILKEEEYKETPAEFKGSEDETTVVDRVIIYSDTNGKLCIKCMIRHTRRPEIGDRFSSRHGQKGVCGTIVQQEDLPFSELGICPDLIINPHGFARYDLYSILVCSLELFNIL
ncbi:hypothetical protein ZIOFF_066046 [Zingiber officinale]|uniref:DNA-directed RNA polymerase n=1 Tax=Zingiber officinale TaxID=94328 RepID=A0A8J5F2W9_ZINOF|nr:hypothetical protein ZIOFF_066046 [Zingiber officinale]